jgi:hypothetical protein
MTATCTEKRNALDLEVPRQARANPSNVAGPPHLANMAPFGSGGEAFLTDRTKPRGLDLAAVRRLTGCELPPA